MAIIRGPLPQDRFFIIDRAWARDWRLSLKEKGALMYICSHHEAYDLTTEQMIAENDDGRDSVLSALRGLEAKGYLVRVQRRLKAGESEKVRAGTFNGYDYQLTQPPPCAARPKIRRTRKGKADLAGEEIDASPQVGTVDGLSGDGEPDSGPTGAGGSAPKRDQGLEDQRLGDHPPPPPASRPPTQRRPLTAAAESPPEPKPNDDIKPLVTELHTRRPRWSARAIAAAVREEIDAGIRFELVAAAARLCYADPRTRSPARLHHDGPWWMQAADQLGPAPGAGSHRPPWCGHPDCDQTTRLRVVEINGMPRGAKCPQCHPRLAAAM